MHIDRMRRHITTPCCATIGLNTTEHAELPGPMMALTPRLKKISPAAVQSAAERVRVSWMTGVNFT